MKKLLLFAALLSLNQLYPQNFEWASKEDFIHATAGFSLASDASGNVYAAGIYATTDSTDPAGLYVCKYNPNGNLMWYQKARVSYAGGIESIHIAVDYLGNPIITGSMRCAGIYFYSANLYVHGSGANILLAKFNTNGILQWAFQDGGHTGIQFAKYISVDIAGNIYVGGSYNDTASYQGHPMPSAIGGSYASIVKFTSNGIVRWARCVTGTLSGDEGSAAKPDLHGNVYFTSNFAGNAYFDTIKLVSPGSYDIFLAKLDSVGNFIWAQRAGGPYSYTSNGPDGQDMPYAIDVDWADNAYITGGFSSNATFGTHHILSQGGARDVFVAKYDPTGYCIWVNSTGTAANDEWATAITVDAQGNSYVNGMDFLNKFNSNGSYAWTINSTAANTGMALGNSPNSLYIGGAFYNSATFGSLSLSSNNVQYGYVVKMTDTTNQSTGIAQIKHLQNDLLVYPNPSNGSITISCTLQKRGSACIQVKNSLGQQIYFESIKETPDSFIKQINLDNLSRGIYFVELIQNGRLVIQKVIID